VTAAAVDQTFCADCGSALPAERDALAVPVVPAVAVVDGEAVDALSTDTPWVDAATPADVPRGAVPPLAVPVVPADAADAVVAVVDGQAAAQGAAALGAEVVAALPSVGDVPAPAPVVRTMILEQQAVPMHVDPRGPLRLTPALIASVATAAVVVLGLVLPFARIEVSGDAFDDLALGVNDISSNLLVALLLATGLSVVGAALASTSRAWGRGQCLGASAILAGLLGLVAGGGVLVVDEQVVRWRTTPGTFQVVTTYGAGFVVVLVAVVGALVTTALALPGLRAEPTESHTILAATAGVIGGVGSCAMAAGPLLPGPGGDLLDNMTSTDWPPAALWARLAFVLIVLAVGLVGSLVGRRWSWGALAAVAAVTAWLNTTALGGFGDQPFGVALGSVAIDPADPYTPHVLTSGGVGAVVVAVTLGTLSAFSRQRETHG